MFMVAMCVHMEASGDIPREDTVSSDIVLHWDMELIDYERLASQSWRPTLPCLPSLPSRRITNMHPHALLVLVS